MGKKDKNKIRGVIRAIAPKKIKKDSLVAKLMKEDQQAFIDDPAMSGFVREYVPGEFPEGDMTEEEKKNTKYVLVKKSRRAVGMNLLGRYPLNQQEFEYYQQDSSRMEELEPAQNADNFYQIEE